MSRMVYPIPEKSRLALFQLLAGLSMVLMVMTGGGLNSKRTPLGIVALELAGMVRGAVRQNPAEQSGWFGSVLKPWADEPVTGSIDIIHSFSFPVFGPPAIF